MTDKCRRGGTIIDGHVHLYKCFEIQKFLTAASRNLHSAAQRIAPGKKHSLVLMLTEGNREDAFERLQGLAEGKRRSKQAPANSWRVRRIPDDESALLATNEQEDDLLIIAGQQVISYEGLEILALATDQKIADNIPLSELTQFIHQLRAILVIPWGVGKWLGERGRIVKKFIESDIVGNIFLGDILGRPAFWPRSSIFHIARSRGIQVLPGTDPLPLTSEATRVGTCGFYLDHGVALDRPTEAVRELLNNNEIVVSPYLQRESTWRFFRNQIRIRIR